MLEIYSMILLAIRRVLARVLRGILMAIGINIIVSTPRKKGAVEHISNHHFSKTAQQSVR